MITEYYTAPTWELPGIQEFAEYHKVIVLSITLQIIYISQEFHCIMDCSAISVSNMIENSSGSILLIVRIEVGKEMRSIFAQDLNLNIFVKENLPT